MAVATKTQTKATQVAMPRIIDAVTEVYLITKAGLYELSGEAAVKLAQKIENDTSHDLLGYRRYDEDKRTWAYWAVQDGETIRPLDFPLLQQYNTKSPQLYAKAVVFPQILARVLRKLKEKPPTLWDKMMKPTTLVLAILAIVLLVGLALVATTG